MQVTVRAFGKTAEGRQVRAYRLTNSAGAWVELLDYGCAIRAIVVPDCGGRLTDVALGYDTIGEYEKQDGCLGAVVGRFANRIGGGKLKIDGREYRLAINNGPNHLHGGLRGFDRRIWSAAADPQGVTFARLSPDGEEGYPGNLTVRVRYSWSEDNVLSIRYTAQTDAPTAVNLTNHCYFNLNGTGSALGHLLSIQADSFTENDPDCLPTGRILPLDAWPAMDFRTAKPVGRDIGAADRNLLNGSGYDHNYILRVPGLAQEAACLQGDRSGIVMTCRTTQPGLQLYSGNFLSERGGKNGQVYRPRDGVCLETQHFPDGIAKGFAPSPILRPGEKLEECTIYAFSCDAQG